MYVLVEAFFCMCMYKGKSCEYFTLGKMKTLRMYQSEKKRERGTKENEKQVYYTFFPQSYTLRFEIFKIPTFLRDSASPFRLLLLARPNHWSSRSWSWLMMRRMMYLSQRMKLTPLPAQMKNLRRLHPPDKNFVLRHLLFEQYISVLPGLGRFGT